MISAKRLLVLLLVGKFPAGVPYHELHAVNGPFVIGPLLKVKKVFAPYWHKLKVTLYLTPAVIGKFTVAYCQPGLDVSTKGTGCIRELPDTLQMRA